MGLDMYLSKRKKNTNGNIFEEIAYWRKANHLHNWFNRLSFDKCGKDIQNCGDFTIEKNDLVELAIICNKVLNDHSLAVQLLPTISGFFFGNTEYDKCYFDDIQYTLNILEKIIKETDFDQEEIFYMAWW